MADNNKIYTLLVRGKRIPVTQEIYKAYYHCRDREKYLDKLAEKNNISLEGCAEKGISVEYIIAIAEDSMEDTIILNEAIAKMLRCPDARRFGQEAHRGAVSAWQKRAPNVQENRCSPADNQR
jgi:hypothetical protein